MGDVFGKLYGYLSSEEPLEPKEIGKYLQQAEDGVYIKGRSGKQCKEEVATLLLLLKAYGRVAWYAIESFGIPVELMDYYRDWNDFDEFQVCCLHESLNGSVQFERDDMDKLN